MVRTQYIEKQVTADFFTTIHASSHKHAGAHKRYTYNAALSYSPTRAVQILSTEIQRGGRETAAALYGQQQKQQNCKNTWGEETSRNLWSRYDRHFVGITRYNLWIEGAKI